MSRIVTSPQPMLSLWQENISYESYLVLQDITLQITGGEKVAIIGKSGAGKTTLLRYLYKKSPDKCAFVHQQHNLVPQLTTFHNIYMGRLNRYSIWENLRNLFHPSPRRLLEIRPIAKHLGLQDKLHNKTGELSGGQQQRVGIGRAIYQGGSVILADEPVSSLDMVQQREIMKLLVNTGDTVVATLHSIELARQYFDRVVGLRNKTVMFDLQTHLLDNDMIAELYR